MNHVAKKYEGFTIIELLLAMAFISFLLLSIALTVVQIGSIYNRGMISKDLNQSTRQVASEFDTAINASGVTSLTAADHHYIQQTWGGRLCVGNYSYVWNYASALNPSSPNGNRNKFKSTTVPNLPFNQLTLNGATKYEIGLVKVADSGASLCIPNGTTGAYPDIDTAKATELLRSGDHSLLLHYLAINTPVSDVVSAQKLYKMTIVIGTSDMSAVTGSGASTVCTAPGNPGADPDYCNVQKITLVLRVASGVN